MEKSLYMFCIIDGDTKIHRMDTFLLTLALTYFLKVTKSKEKKKHEELL